MPPLLQSVCSRFSFSTSTCFPPSTFIMSCRFPALLVVSAVLLRVQSVSAVNAPSSSSELPFDLPEIDGSAVDTCRIFPFPTPDAPPTTTATAATLTPEKLVATTKTPAVQSTTRTPEPKTTRPPIRAQPAPAGPITTRLLYYLLANSRRHAAALLPGVNGIFSQPIGGQPRRGQSSSDSDESAAALRRGVGRRTARRWRAGSLSSDDSSDES